jgi:hypothetical protein
MQEIIKHDEQLKKNSIGVMLDQAEQIESNMEELNKNMQNDQEEVMGD